MCAMINIYAYYVTFITYLIQTKYFYLNCLSFEDIWIILLEMHVLLIVPQLTILHHKKYFSNLTLVPFNVQTISEIVNLIKGSGRATIVLPNGTKFQIDDILYSNKSCNTPNIFFK